MAGLGLLTRGARAQSEPSTVPAWVPSSHLNALHAPLPARTQSAPPASGQTFETDADPTGLLETIITNGQSASNVNPYFQTLGTNGRICATCHQISSGSTVSALAVQMRYLTTNGTDPIFAPVDGANCPDAVPASSTAPSPVGGLRGQGLENAVVNVLDPNNPHSLLLQHGLIRIGLPWPPKGANGTAITPEFTIQVLSDPTKCENNVTYGLGNAANPIISVYRRPLVTANLKFVTVAGVAVPAVDPFTGLPNPTDPYTGLPESGNIMWDGREPTLESQATDAVLIHEQAMAPPTATQLQGIVAFETAVFAAQAYSAQAGSLTSAGAMGGPASLVTQAPGLAGIPPFAEFASWANVGTSVPLGAAKESVARGEAIFNTRGFTINNVAGFNDVTFVGNNVAGTCSTCHGMTASGNDYFVNAERDLGTVGDTPSSLAEAGMPSFQLTCQGGATTPYHGTVVTVRDPGKALITGKCEDIGKIKVPQLRALAARAPYFHDGSAANLQEVVNFYNSRFAINLTAQEQQDLINFMRSL